MIFLKQGSQTTGTRSYTAPTNITGFDKRQTDDHTHQNQSDFVKHDSKFERLLIGDQVKPEIIEDQVVCSGGGENNSKKVVGCFETAY